MFPAPREVAPMPAPEFGFALFPALMNMPSGPRPGVPPAGFVFALFPCGVPAGTPGCDPAGEIEMRAERLPGGTKDGGATGAGVAESAISVRTSPAGCGESSGASAALSPLRRAARGADMGLTGNAGLCGACADAAMSISPGCFSGIEISGTAESCAERDTGSLGRIAANCSGVSCDLGRAGSDAASRTMFGSCGKIFGGSGGAAG